MVRKFLPSREDIESILRTVKEPETGLSLWDLGLVKAIDYIEAEKKLLIYVDFRSRLPSCPACVGIAWNLQRSVLENLFDEFYKYEGIKEIELRDVEVLYH